MKSTRPARDKPPPRFLFQWRRAIAASDLPRELRATARALSDYMDMDGGHAFPSQRLLAQDLGIHFQTVKRHLRKLRAKGWLVVVRAGTGPGRSNLYEATIPGIGSAGAPYSAAGDGIGSAGDGIGSAGDAIGSAGVANREHNSDPLSPSNSPSNSYLSHRKEREEEKEEPERESSGDAFTPERGDFFALKERLGRDKPVDALRRRCIERFAGSGVPAGDCIRVVGQLRGEGIADEIIDMALGQCENAGARSLGYLLKVARDFYAQRTGGK